MKMTNATFQEASVYPKKYSRETSLPAVGQHSRAIIPGDDPGDQQLPGRAITKRQTDPHLARCRAEYPEAIPYKQNSLRHGTRSIG